MDVVCEELVDRWLSESESDLTDVDDDPTESAEYSSEEDDALVPELSFSRQFLTGSSVL